MDRATEIFESHRQRLFRLAYGMLKRVAPAKDAVQEAYIRWQKQDVEQVRSPGSYLSTIVSRICLDEIKSARNRKEEYIGPDLPEPLLTAEGDIPDENMELSEAVSMAMLVVLDELGPVQRAVYILREIFDYDYAAIADMVQKSESHCRKIAQRARDRIQEHRPRFEQSSERQNKLVTAFLDAVQNGDMSKMESMLAKEAILYSDGGGKVTAARKPIYSAPKIAKFMVGIQKQVPDEAEFDIAFERVNGEPGMIVWLDDSLYNAWSFHIEEGKIHSIYVVLNPDKLRHLKESISDSRGFKN